MNLIMIMIFMSNYNIHKGCGRAKGETPPKVKWRILLKVICIVLLVVKYDPEVFINVRVLQKKSFFGN